MAAARIALAVVCTIVVMVGMISTAAAQGNNRLGVDYYDDLCPGALPVIRAVVERAIQREPRVGASIIRLHFHDCFVNGCDGSNLLDDTDGFIGEKTALPNNMSARGFEIIDEIKAAVDDACYGASLVSCADILAVAARDSVAVYGGPSYAVQVGRHDARTASRDAANNDLTPPTADFSALLDGFKAKGLSLRDLVALYGAHTVGFAQCQFFRNRTHNSTTDIDPYFQVQIKNICPASGADERLAPLDPSPARFDNAYFRGLLEKKGLLNSDQQLFRSDGSDSDQLVKLYSENVEAFWEDFGTSMIKMGGISPLTENQGEVRRNCRKLN